MCFSYTEVPQNRLYRTLHYSVHSSAVADHTNCVRAPNDVYL